MGEFSGRASRGLDMQDFRVVPDDDEPSIDHSGDAMKSAQQANYATHPDVQAFMDSCGDDDDATKVEKLIRLLDSADFFSDDDQRACADVIVDGHRETHRVDGSRFRLWIQHRAHAAKLGAPSSRTLEPVLDHARGRALFDSPVRRVSLRTAEHEGEFFIDLGDEEWTSVRVSPLGWSVEPSPPVRFRRTQTMQALPRPVRGGSVAELRPFVNVATEADFGLLVSWVLASLLPSGPYPILALVGEQGTGKSTLTRTVRRFIDPSKLAIRSSSPTIRDLFVAAENSWVLAFDNLTSIPPALSDALCTLATGGGFGIRANYKDDEEKAFFAQRPQILNGITDFVSRPDLADRSLFLNLEPIDEDERRTDRELSAELAEAAPRIFGALLDVMVHGLRQRPTVKLESKPRMADFATWGVACEGAFWGPGEFMRAYSVNRREALERLADARDLVGVMREFMENRDTWAGSAKLLLQHLNEIKGADEAKRDKYWPGAPNVLTRRLRTDAPMLRHYGIEWCDDRAGDKSNGRVVRVRKLSA